MEGPLYDQGLCGLKKLQELDLQGNSFEGTLPSCLYNLTSLQRCDNKKVEIETENSDWVPLFQLESLVISNCSLNKLSHRLPTFLFHQHSLRSLGLEHTGLKGPFPDWLFRNNTRLKYAILHDNSFSGHFHLPLFLNSTHGIDVSNNQLIGKLQRNIGEILPNIRYLILSNNSFSGSLPSSIGNMSLLSVFDVSFNNFSGEVPKELPVENLVDFSLEFVNSFLDPDGINVYELDVEVNFVTKYRLSSYKGGILTYMSGLDLSCNNLIGEIPPELGQLQEIHALNLSHNQLIGSIPKSFSNLTELESLDLSHNRLSREIPPQLIELTFLAVFSVAYNNLSGRTPDMKAQFGTFQASSYDGNPFLCGVPLEKSCSNNKDASPPTPTQSSNWIVTSNSQ
ncbi:receptor-like protein 15 [Quercus suber]|uniref:Receptor-like protein 15 n=1 Tax=Quercus suber TaxID=58331 RepID=A0AAW0L3X5_QUESU